VGLFQGFVTKAISNYKPHSVFTIMEAVESIFRESFV
jgi:hypothetical protein